MNLKNLSFIALLFLTGALNLAEAGKNTEKRKFDEFQQNNNNNNNNNEDIDSRNKIIKKDNFSTVEELEKKIIEEKTKYFNLFNTINYINQQNNIFNVNQANEFERMNYINHINYINNADLLNDVNYTIQFNYTNSLNYINYINHVRSVNSINMMNNINQTNDLRRQENIINDLIERHKQALLNAETQSTNIQEIDQDNENVAESRSPDKKADAELGPNSNAIDYSQTLLNKEQEDKDYYNFLEFLANKTDEDDTTDFIDK
ncbi:MAG: hypothetical protein Q8L85_07885 [Alphaproteobacteria bacterium]|nr:hypothetical protein [Alphaproteobacteria bacterium]